MNKNQIAFLTGTRLGWAIADTAISEGLPYEWTGLDPQDGDQLAAAGIEPKTPEWAMAEKAAENAYHQYLKTHKTMKKINGSRRMNAKLIDQVEYLDGCVSNQRALDEEINVDQFAVVESNLRGWGSANAVVLVDGSHYLAVVSECK